MCLTKLLKKKVMITVEFLLLITWHSTHFVVKAQTLILVLTFNLLEAVNLICFVCLWKWWVEKEMKAAVLLLRSRKITTMGRFFLFSCMRTVWICFWWFWDSLEPWLMGSQHLCWHLWWLGWWILLGMHRISQQMSSLINCTT